MIAKVRRREISWAGEDMGTAHAIDQWGEGKAFSQRAFARARRKNHLARFALRRVHRTRAKITSANPDPDSRISHKCLRPVNEKLKPALPQNLTLLSAHSDDTVYLKEKT